MTFWAMGYVGLMALQGLSTGPREPAILEELERLDKGLERAETELVQKERVRQALSQELAGLHTEMASAKIQQQEAAAAFKRRLRALSRLPAGARYALLGSSTSLRDYLQTSRLLRQVAARDVVLRGVLTARREHLTRLTAAAQHRQEALQGALLASRAARDVLAGERRARAELLQNVRTQAQRARALAEESRAARRKLQSMVARLPGRSMSSAPTGRGPPSLKNNTILSERAPFSKRRGHLPWPAAGPVRLAFGQRVELAFGTVTSHNGWDIAARSGARVQAVAAGNVVYAGWLRGYGQVVIIDHGDGYHSVAAHLAGVDVAVGDLVESGQQLGTVGDTGSLRGTILYFEIRHHGAPQDPRPWLTH